MGEDRFCRDYPSPDTAVDLFAGQWSSRLPDPYGELTGGKAELFDDARIKWCASEFGSLSGLNALELGPLEGGHTYMLDRLGVGSVTSIEANTDAFLRCLVVKELLRIPSARFLCGDFVKYLEDAAGRNVTWDLCLAVGVLYHQEDPVSLLKLIASVSERLLLWTHYYDASAVARNERVAAHFSTSHHHEIAGFSHTLYHYEYSDALGWGGFCGGLERSANWISRTDLLGALAHLGYEVVAIGFDDPNADHPNGPGVAICAQRA
jgi:hypothetical protein